MIDQAGGQAVHAVLSAASVQAVQFDRQISTAPGFSTSTLPLGALPGAVGRAGGWPVALFGHGFTDCMFGAPWTVAAVLASRGIATMSINVVGHACGTRAR